MSGELAEALWRRATVYLREAKHLYSEGQYDVALVMAEQATQLGIKAVYARLLGAVPRGHSLRRLLGYLASVLEEASKQEEEAMLLRDFVASNRDSLVLLEDAYIQGRYDVPGYTRSEAEKGISTVTQLLELLGKLLGMRHG